MWQWLINHYEYLRIKCPELVITAAENDTSLNLLHRITIYRWYNIIFFHRNKPFSGSQKGMYLTLQWLSSSQTRYHSVLQKNQVEAMWSSLVYSKAWCYSKMWYNLHVLVCSSTDYYHTKCGDTFGQTLISRLQHHKTIS